MTTPFLPQFGMPIVDKNGKAAMQLQQFFMRLAQGSGTISITVAGKPTPIQILNFGDGFSGTVSGTAFDLSSGIDVIGDQGVSLTTSTIEFGSGFSVTEKDGTVVVSGGGTSLRIMQNGVQISAGVDVLNFTGNVNAQMISDEVYIAVGGVAANGDNGNYSNLVSGSGITLTPDSSGDLTLSASGAEFIQGTVTTSGALTIGSNLTLSGSTLNGSSGASGISGLVQGTATTTGLITLANGLSLSGQSLAASTNIFQGGTVTATPVITLGTNLSLSSGTLNAAGGSAGSTGVYSGGTLYPTLAAGSNITLSGSGPTLTASASGGGSGGTTYGLYGQGGTLIASPNPTTPTAFGPFTTSNCRFDTGTSITITAGHLYRIDVSFSVYAPTSGNGGNVCVRDSSGTHGYFGAMANYVSGNQFQTIYSVNGTSFTSLQSGPNEHGNQQAQTFQLFFIATASGNILWSRSFSGLCGASAINTVASLLGGPITFGYASNLTDVFTMKVYDMGPMA